jgi:hypothetical protein
MKKIAIILTLPILFGACASLKSSFPTSPKQHRFYQQLSSPPSPYYASVTQAYYDRLTKTDKVGTAWRQLVTVSYGWTSVDKLESINALDGFLKAQKLRFLAGQMKRALDKHNGERPSSPDSSLEAGAMKQALVYSYYKLKRKLGK